MPQDNRRSTYLILDNKLFTMKHALVMTLAILLAFRGMGQPYPGKMNPVDVPAPAYHYTEEYNFDSTLNPTAWERTGKGLHAAFGSTEELYFRSEVPVNEQESMTLKKTAWRGERVNAQLLLWSRDSLQQVRVKIGDFRKKNGKTIPGRLAKVNLVRYVISNYPYGAKDATCGESHYKDVYLMPDRFEPFERFDLPARTTRPVWISLDIPAGTEPGTYIAIIEVAYVSGSNYLEMQVEVQALTLPEPGKWKHRLDLWQNPWVVAWENKLTPWSEEHKLLLKKHLKMYADAGGTFITTYAVHSPWADNSYMIEGGMIEWIRQRDYKWKFDYSVFDDYVQLAMSVGINEAITIYTPVPWGNRFRYLDEETGNYVYETWAPGTNDFRNMWNAFLTDLKKHLQKKGWFSKTYLGINENPMDQTLAAIQAIREHSPEWRITYAGDWHPELDLLIDDYCFLYGKESDVEIVRKRRERGQTTTYYVCCNPPVPNNFVFSPPVEGRWISWYSVAHGYDGFLRWAYDAWPSDVSRDARHPFWPAGDCFLVYPGGNSCIRFEKLREGIVDFEKIRILRELAARSKKPDAVLLLNKLNEHLESFLEEKDFDKEKLKEDIRIGTELVDELSNLL